MKKHTYIFSRRFISALVSITFVSTNLLVMPSHAMGVSASAERKHSSIDSSSVSVPQQFGKIQETFKGNGDQTVILVQDAHAIADAQRNIQKLIGHFQNEYGLNLIALEGAASELDPQIFRSFPDKEILKKIFDGYMEKGEVTGSTAAAIFNPNPAIYRGIEDWALYEKGLGLYQKTMDKVQEIQAKIDAEKKDLQKKKEVAYSKELLELDNALANFHSNRGNLIDVMKKLAAIKAPEKGSELALLLEEANQDQESQTPQELEVKKIAVEVKNALESSHAAKSDLVSFNDKFQEFQTSKISAQAFAVFLEELASKANLPLKISGRLSHSMNNQKRMRDIEGTRLFSDFEQYTQSVKNSLFKNDEEKKLDRRTHSLELIERMNRLELSREDWNELKEMPLDSPFKELLKPHFAFYENAQVRDEVMFKNLLKQMGRESSLRANAVSEAISHAGLLRPAFGRPRNDSTALLVAGGFHTESLIQKFKDQGISYILLMPQINSIPANSHYREHMKGDVSWKDHYQVENGKVNLYKAFVRGTRDALLKESKDESGQLLKKWRDQIIQDLAQHEKIEKVQEYTSFIDETASKNQKVLPQWRIKLEKFIEGLRKLDSEGKLTEQNVLNLFKPSTHPDVTYSDIATGSILDVGYLPIDIPRSETRSQEQWHEEWLMSDWQGLRSEVRVPSQALQDIEPSQRSVGYFKIGDYVLGDMNFDKYDSFESTASTMQISPNDLQKIASRSEARNSDEKAEEIEQANEWRRDLAREVHLHGFYERMREHGYVPTPATGKEKTVSPIYDFLEWFSQRYPTLQRNFSIQYPQLKIKNANDIAVIIFTAFKKGGVSLLNGTVEDIYSKKNHVAWVQSLEEVFKEVLKILLKNQVDASTFQNAKQDYESEASKRKESEGLEYPLLALFMQAYPIKKYSSADEIAHANKFSNFEEMDRRLHSRSEVRRLTDEIVDVFQTNQERHSDWTPVLRAITNLGGEEVASALEASAEVAMARADIRLGSDAKTNLANILSLNQRTERSILIQDRILPVEIAKMGGEENAAEIISNEVKAAYDLVGVQSRFQADIIVPLSMKGKIKLKDLNRNDGIKIRFHEDKIGDEKVYRITIQTHEDALNDLPEMGIGYSLQGQIETLLTNQYAENNQEVTYEGPEGKKLRANFFLGAAAFKAQPLENRTFKLIQEGNGRRFWNQEEAYALGALVNLVAQYRAQLRTKVAA